MGGSSFHKASSFIVVLSLLLQSYAPVAAQGARKAEPARAREAVSPAIEEADGYQPPEFAHPQPRTGRPENNSAVSNFSEINQNTSPDTLTDLPPITISSIYYTDTVRATLTQSASGQTLYVSSSSGFAAGDEVLVMAMKGSQAGQYETAYAGSVFSDRLELTGNLISAYDTTAGACDGAKNPTSRGSDRRLGRKYHRSCLEWHDRRRGIFPG